MLDSWTAKQVWRTDEVLNTGKILKVSFHCGGFGHNYFYYNTDNEPVGIKLEELHNTVEEAAEYAKLKIARRIEEFKHRIAELESIKLTAETTQTFN